MSSYPLAAALATALVFFIMALLLRLVVFRLLHGAAGLTDSAADDQILQVLRKRLFNAVSFFGVTLAIALVGLLWGEKFLIHAVLSSIVVS